MAVGVPRIWTLKSVARPLPPDTENDLIAIDKIRSVLPQDAGDSYSPLILTPINFTDELMLIAFPSPPAYVDFNDMLGERPSFFTRVKAKSKNKPKESMVPASFASTAPLPAAVPAMNPLLKRVMPLSLAPPQKKKCPLPKNKVASKLRIRGSEEDAVLSQGSVSPLEPTAPLAVTVDLTSSDTHADTGMGLHSEPHVPLQVEPFSWLPDLMCEEGYLS
ncbi:hypothetical protein LIER_28702 [Lithospermum erythrorhizon]|uniref:Uncharacterized protein n=1 Tax=Lithospermum erythrorhizon TaxID=34254 RepID=A0AAV3RI73_LITER